MHGQVTRDVNCHTAINDNGQAIRYLNHNMTRIGNCHKSRNVHGHDKNCEL